MVLKLMEMLSLWYSQIQKEISLLEGDFHLEEEEEEVPEEEVLVVVMEEDMEEDRLLSEEGEVPLEEDQEVLFLLEEDRQEDRDLQENHVLLEEASLVQDHDHLIEREPIHQKDHEVLPQKRIEGDLGHLVEADQDPDLDDILAKELVFIIQLKRIQ